MLGTLHLGEGTTHGVLCTFCTYKDDMYVYSDFKRISFLYSCMYMYDRIALKTMCFGPKGTDEKEPAHYAKICIQK